MRRKSLLSCTADPGSATGKLARRGGSPRRYAVTCGLACLAFSAACLSTPARPEREPRFVGHEVRDCHDMATCVVDITGFSRNAMLLITVNHGFFSADVQSVTDDRGRSFEPLIPAGLWADHDLKSGMWAGHNDDASTIEVTLHLTTAAIPSTFVVQVYEFAATAVSAPPATKNVATDCRPFQSSQVEIVEVPRLLFGHGQGKAQVVQPGPLFEPAFQDGRTVAEFRYIEKPGWYTADFRCTEPDPNRTSPPFLAMAVVLQ